MSFVFLISVYIHAVSMFWFCAARMAVCCACCVSCVYPFLSLQDNRNCKNSLNSKNCNTLKCRIEMVHYFLLELISSVVVGRRPLFISNLGYFTHAICQKSYNHRHAFTHAWVAICVLPLNITDIDIIRMEFQLL